MITQVTYGFLRINLNVASGPRWRSDVKPSLMCSFALFTSSDEGIPLFPSSSARNRYRNTLSLKGCSRATDCLTCKNKLINGWMDRERVVKISGGLNYHEPQHLPPAAPATSPSLGCVYARQAINSRANRPAQSQERTFLSACLTLCGLWGIRCCLTIKASEAPTPSLPWLDSVTAKWWKGKNKKSNYFIFSLRKIFMTLREIN